MAVASGYSNCGPNLIARRRFASRFRRLSFVLSLLQFGKDRVVFGLMEAARLVEFDLCLFFSSHGLIKSGQPPMDVGVLRSQLDGGLELAKRVFAAAAARIDDAQIHVCPSIIWVELDRLLNEGESFV